MKVCQRELSNIAESENVPRSVVPSTSDVGEGEEENPGSEPSHYLE